MSDLNVVAHGINPETGEYLSAAERKALFKRQRMGSKINTESFRSGTVSATKKSGGGSGGGAIVKFNVRDVVSAGSIVKRTPIPEAVPDESVQEVKVEDLDEPKKEQKQKINIDFTSILEKLKETFDKILNLKNKQSSVKSKTSVVEKKRTKLAAKKKKVSKKSAGKDVFGIGRKINYSATKAFGDIFGIFGDILQFAALNWLSDPRNKETIKTVVMVAGEIFKWIDSTVSWAVDNTLTGFSELVGPDNPISVRMSGFFKLASVFFALRYLTNPLKIIKDLRRVFKIVQRFGKFVNKIFKKPLKMISNFVEGALNRILGKSFKSNLLKGVRRFILKVGGRSLLKLLKGVGRGFTKIISRIPVLGGLLDFALNVFVFKENPGRSAFKAIGAGLLGAIGTGFGGPLGAVIGGFAGDWAGGKVYDIFFGGEKETGDKDKTKKKETTPSGSPGATPSASLTGVAAERIGDDQEFLSEVNRVSEKFNIKPSDLLGLMASESGLNPQSRNTKSGATGLIQFMPDTAKALGTTTAELYKMSRAEQMKYVEKYFDYWKLPKGATPGHLYTSVYLPAFTHKPANYVLAQKGGFSDSWGHHPASWYSQNAGLDQNGDNSITIAELGERVQKKKREFGISDNLNLTPQSSSPTPKPSQNLSMKGNGSPPQETKPSPLVTKPPTPSPMPEMSSIFSINKKMRSTSSSTVPIIINNMQNSTLSTTVTALPLNSTSISSTTVLNRL